MENPSDIEILFYECAEKFLNNSILQVKNKRYRICEIEMYYYNDKHPDAYTHCDELQLEYNKFYPHRFKNKTYKAGTYKCMDIVYGDKNTKTFFGILIRSIKDIDADKDCEQIFFTGPCISVNEILKQYNMTEFSDFMKKYDINKEFKIIDYNLEHEDIFIGPRVGLGDKYSDYKEKKYRYATHIKQIKKQKIFEKLE
jgi:hypothetical protein